MKALQRLVRLRREDDRVKLMLVFLLLAGVLLGQAVSATVSYGALLREPVEVVLSAGQSGAALDGALQRLLEQPEVVGASRQRSLSLTAGDRSLQVTELDSAYLAACYGIEAGEARRFWLGEAAFAAFCGPTAESPVSVDYTGETGPARAAFYRVDALPAGTAVTRGTTRSLSGTSQARVRFARSDPSGADEQRLQSLGLTVENTEAQVRLQAAGELTLTRLGFSLLGAGLSLLLVRVYGQLRRASGD